MFERVSLYHRDFFVPIGMAGFILGLDGATRYPARIRPDGDLGTWDPYRRVYDNYDPKYGRSICIEAQTP